MRTQYRFRLAAILLAATIGYSIISSGSNSATAADDPVTEQTLLATLRSDAPASEKAITCKRLAIYGSSESVPDLAKLLPDPQLSSWARIALEVIPDESSDEALREASESLDGRLLVGVLNSIGVRRDNAAVDLLTERLESADAQVASAAAVALGMIGTAEAATSLRSSLATAPEVVRSAIAEGCVLCAERCLNDGDTDEAVAIYDEVRQAKLPQQRVLEATRGAILARGEEGIPLLLEQFQSSEKAMFQLALGTAREFPGSGIDKALANLLASSDPSRAALIVQAMADRPQTVVMSAVLEAAKNGDKQVRLSAIDALSRIGDDSCLSALMAISKDADSELAEAANQTLAELPGDRIDQSIVALLGSAEAGQRVQLLNLVGKRRIKASAELLKALDDPATEVRAAALSAMGETVEFDQLPVLISRATSSEYAKDADDALQALKVACIRMPDREACGAELAKAVRTSTPETQSALLEILADVGGKNALKELAAAAKSDDALLQDTGSRLLGKWSFVDAGDVLLDLAKTAPEEKYQVRALRGYISLARRFAMPEVDRVAMCSQAMEAAKRTDEQKLVLDALALHPSPEGLKLVMDSTRNPKLKEEATAASLVIAQKLAGKGVDVAQLLALGELEKVKLEIVSAEYGAGSTQKDVTALIRKHASDLPWVTLTSPSYNASFGGDPVPGTVKRLTIRYRIDGKPGEASFAENALIILPLPK